MSVGAGVGMNVEGVDTDGDEDGDGDGSGVELENTRDGKRGQDEERSGRHSERDTRRD